MQMGAIVSAQHHDKILDYIEPGKSDGAVLDAGGDSVSPPDGVFIVPTVFSGVARHMAIAQDENFGPVVSIIAFETAEEAISMAFDTDYGLVASVWSKNIGKALDLIPKIRAGRRWKNATIVGGPERQMGDFKRSGTGRECGKMGVGEHMETKSIHVALGDREHQVG